MMKKRLINIFISSIISICCTAQTEGYKYYATLDSIKTAGFYKIILSPEINAHLKTDYSDVRVVNGEGKWVPHAMHIPTVENKNNTAKVILNYLLKENNKTNTLLNINAENLPLNNLNLIIRNTAAERYCTFSGSDNGIEWFVVSDSIIINPFASETKSINNFSFNFPLSNYKNYKLNIINNNKDPFEIVGINTSTQLLSSSVTNNKIINNPITTLIQKDSGKVSYIKIIQQKPFHFDALNLKVSGVKYYSRNVDIFIPTNTTHSFINPGSLLQSFTISNNRNSNFQIPIINDSVFYLRINNEDNLPLKVNEVSTSLNEHFLKTYVEVGSYRLLLGNTNAIQPKYDISNLSFNKSDSLLQLKIKAINAFPQNEITKTKKDNNQKWIIWIALVLGLCILLLLTKKMIKEVDKNKNNDTI